MNCVANCTYTPTVVNSRNFLCGTHMQIWSLPSTYQYFYFSRKEVQSHESEKRVRGFTKLLHSCWIRSWKFFWSDIFQEKSSKTWTASQGNLHYHEYDALDAQGCSIVQESVSKSYNSGLLHQESICKFGYGIMPDVSCLGFESTSVLYLCMSPKKREKLWMIDLENAP